jgi:hypothetical protein
MFSDDCEMAYGEQAALIGMVELLRPKIAIEIGTYDGGSLALIAPRCERVHTFDLVSHVDEHLPNVTYHLGDSAIEVPRVLGELERQGENVDFVLIDGDHSRVGVRRDLSNILNSPAAARTVVMCHDVGNEAVRAGIRDALHDASDPAYANLSFVPPWEPTNVLEEVWGGLGVLVVDDVGDLWPHKRRVDTNVEWPSAVRRSVPWHATRPLRAVRRQLGYRARPIVRRLRGVRGVKS